MRMPRFQVRSLAECAQCTQRVLQHPAEWWPHGGRERGVCVSQRDQARRVDIDFARHRSSMALPSQPRGPPSALPNGAAASSREQLSKISLSHHDAAV